MSAIQNIQESMKGLSAEELLAIIAFATSEAKKAVKSVPKVKEAKEKKGSMPKGVVPPQLRKPRAWVDFTLADANANGWESFQVKGQEEAMPASVLRDGKHVFEATGKPMNNKQAMSLSKVRWDRKEGKGTRYDLYEAFEAQYVEEETVAVAVVESSEPKEEVEAPKPKKEKKAPAPKKTEEEKEAEKAEKLAKKQAEKEAEKLAKKEASKPMTIEVVEEAPKPAAKKIVKKVAKKEEVTPFVCEDDGMAHEWDFKGKKFLRDFDGNMWHRTDDGESAGWAGKFDPATNSIDTTADEPVYEDEE